MIHDTISKIKSKIRDGKNLKDDTKKQLLELVTNLESEVNELSKIKKEQAESITHFTGIYAHETTRLERNPALIQISLQGLDQSIKEFEVSHPKLTNTVNHICQILANMGI
jgi:hypothetical protein